MKRRGAALAAFLLALQPSAALPGFAQDCNLNGVADATDIAGGTSLDCQGDGVPDECDLFPLTYDGSSAASGAFPAAMAVADSPATPIVAVARIGDNSVRLFGNLSGVLTGGLTIPVGNRPEAILATDLSTLLMIGGIGLPDLVVANANDGTVSVLREGLGGTYTNLSGSPFSVGGAPNGLAVGDLTGEGDLDIVVTDRMSGTLVALINDGLGSFFVSLSFPTGGNPHAVVLADVDGDGDLDALVGARATGEVVLLENNAGISFFPATPVYTAPDPIGLASADVDADGDLDLAVLSATAQEVRVLANDGSGAYSLLATVPVGVQPFNVRFADLDGNGTPDLLIPSAGDDAVTVALNAGAGAFGTPVNLPVGDGPVDAVALDFDRDGRLDLVTSDLISQTVTLLQARPDGPDCDASGVPDACELAGDDCNGNGVLDVCEKAGGRGFAPPLRTPASSFGEAIAGGDFDEDGHGDALVAVDGGVRFLRGQEDGALVETSSYATGSGARSVLTVDLDADDHLDVVVANRFDDTVSILRGSGSGAVTGSSLHSTVPDPSDLAAADLDRDGDVDLAVKGSFNTDATVLFLEGGAVDSSATVTFAAPSYGLAAGDVDGDHHPDLISLLSLPGAMSGVQVVRNDGGGTLTPLAPVLTTSPPERLVAFAADDLDGDGAVELALLLLNLTNRVIRLEVATNDGAGGFSVSQILPVAQLPVGAGFGFSLLFSTLTKTGDPDGDGDPDVLVALGASLQVFANDGSGTLALATPVLVGGEYRDYAFSDVDGDGAVDLVMPSVLSSDDVTTTLLSRALPAEGVCFGTCLRRPAPSCIEMERASLLISEKKPGKEKWKLSLQSPGGPVPADFLGDPVGGDTQLGVCVYDEADALVGGLAVDRGGDVCGPRGKPCWKDQGRSGFRYKDPDAASSGVRTIKAASPSAPKTRLSAKAGNDAHKGEVSLPLGAALALQDATAARVQLLTSDGACFEARLADVDKADGVEFKASAR
jgi:hypothetical protein